MWSEVNIITDTKLRETVNKVTKFEDTIIKAVQYNDTYSNVMQSKIQFF